MAGGDDARQEEGTDAAELSQLLRRHRDGSSARAGGGGESPPGHDAGMIAYLPLIFAFVGALIYALINSATQPKLAEIGRLVFFAGFLVGTPSA